MGSTQSFLSPEAAISSAFVAGALAIAYTQFGPKLTPSTPPMLTSTGKGKKGKNKQPDALENSKVVDATATSPEISAVAPSLVPGQFEHTPAEPLSPPDAPAPPKQKNGKKKKAKVASVPAAASSADNHSESSTGTTHPQPAAVADRPSSKPKRQPPMQTPKPIHQSTTSIDTDGSWTRVDPRRRNAQQGTASLAKGLSADVTTSDAGITTSVTGNSSPVAERTKDDDVFAVNMPDAASSGQRRPLAERLLPKPRKTGVDECVFLPIPVRSLSR
jgi:hypothetical protein